MSDLMTREGLHRALEDIGMGEPYWPNEWQFVDLLQLITDLTAEKVVARLRRS